MFLNAISSFLNLFCLHKTYEKFYETLQDFNPHDFIQNYNQFLRYTCYSYMVGSVYNGALLIWRAMKKYLEELQKTDEFKEINGNLLENWCLKQIQEEEFEVEKIILRNKNLELTDNYCSMKE